MPKHPTLTAIIMLCLMWGLPFVRVVTDNATLNVLAGIVVWALMTVSLLVGIVMLTTGTIFYSNRDKLSMTEAKEKSKQPRLPYWRTLGTLVVTIAIYSYVDWTGPAVMYFLAAVASQAGAALTRTAIRERLARDSA